jgi:hypothetical protein
MIIIRVTQYWARPTVTRHWSKGLCRLIKVDNFRLSLLKDSCQH